MAIILWLYLAGCVIVYAGLHTKTGRELTQEMSEQVGDGFFSPEFIAALASLLSWYMVYQVVSDVVRQNFEYWHEIRKIKRIKSISDEDRDKLLDQLRRGRQED